MEPGYLAFDIYYLSEIFFFLIQRWTSIVSTFYLCFKVGGISFFEFNYLLFCSYIGNFVNGKFEGVGTYEDKGCKYEGEFAENVFNGKGMKILRNNGIQNYISTQYSKKRIKI